jgi:hypothetical protein
MPSRSKGALAIGHLTPRGACVLAILGERLLVDIHREPRYFRHGYPSPSRGRSPKWRSNSSPVIGRPPIRSRIASIEVSGASTTLPSALCSTTM